MPEVLFTVQMPDGEEYTCYSPSTVVREYFAAGETLPLAEFVARSRSAYAAANERVRAKYGVGCASAVAQLAEIEARAAASQDPNGHVRITSI